MAQFLEDIKDDVEDSLKEKYLSFIIDEQSYCIDIRYVIEIIVVQPITQVPELPGYVKGIINLRGKVIPVLDVRLRFGKEERVYDDKTCFVVVDVLGSSVGIIVDEVEEVLKIPDENIVQPPSFSKNGSSRYVKGIGKIGEAVKLVLDCQKLLSDDEIDEIVGIADAATEK
ncbi:MAG: chemotaxis protein CheW [Acetanaerobacterium sp.]